MNNLLTRVAAGLALSLTLAATAPKASAQFFYNVKDAKLGPTMQNLLRARSTPNGSFGALANSPVMVIAHRGLVDANNPDNSLASVGNAIFHAIEGMELDISIAKDGTPYLMHDQSLERMVDIANFSDINNWVAHGRPAGLEPLPYFGVGSGGLQNHHLCKNGVNGYGKVFDQFRCNDSGQGVASLESALLTAYNDGYQGLIFLDVQNRTSIYQVGAWLLDSHGLTSPQWTWILNHVVLKFQTQYFGGPADFLNEVTSQRATFGQSPKQVAQTLLVMPVVHSNVAADKEASTKNPAWAVDDYSNWRNTYIGYASNKILGQELTVKAIQSELNHGADDLFDVVWKSGAATGIYQPVNQCTAFNPGTLAGTQGVYVSGGNCAPLVGVMQSNECGLAGGTWTDAGAGCTDHRFLLPFIEGTMHYGFIITDDPIGAIDWISKHGGGRH